LRLGRGRLGLRGGEALRELLERQPVRELGARGRHDLGPRAPRAVAAALTRSGSLAAPVAARPLPAAPPAWLGASPSGWGAPPLAAWQARVARVTCPTRVAPLGRGRPPLRAQLVA